VAYSNAAKVSLLGVSDGILEAEGAVSEPVARAMAEGVRSRFGSDFGVATTGISGPDGGSDEKPVGLVWIALSMSAEAMSAEAMAGGDGVSETSRTHAESFVFRVDRSRHRSLTAQVALDWIRRSVLGVELVGPSLLRRSGGGSAPSGP
jgi:PncC family amidohydrolase